MSKKEGYGRKGIFGNINHYDEKGRRDGLENIERNKWTLKMKKNSNLKYKFEFFFRFIRIIFEFLA